MLPLDVDDLVYIADRVLPGGYEIRDKGLLASAAARPWLTIDGVDAYSTLHDKAAALLSSIVTNHPLIDGNKRLGLASILALLTINGWTLTMSEDDAYELVMAVARGDLRDVGAIAHALVEGSQPARRSSSSE